MEFDWTKVLDVGFSAVLLFIGNKLWQRLTSVEDRLFNYLEEAREQRHKMASQITALSLQNDTREDKP